ncbi:MAG TPA: DUF2075 domain-containing protein [Candidatus Ozemobacteraceae bacterium]|nr:DUF2075 domain-containing protein [Candidatus Ozemobacteraceae bacterium]
MLREALARDKVAHAKLKKQKLSKTEAKSQARMFVQNVHHFRDECLRDDQPPIEHVAIFDAAPRAWNLEQTAAFMRQKKKRPDFTICEPEFLLSCLVSCLDRHGTWATVVCLVGGGQEIITVRPGFRNGWIQSNDRFRIGMCIFSATEVLSQLSSRAQRLRLLAVDIRTPTEPVQWFLCGKEDTRSSFYLEDVATEFQVQGLEIDWGCIVWDGDFRFSDMTGILFRSFRSSFEISHPG